MKNLKPNKFITEYINDCIKSGNSDAISIMEHAKSEIEEIDSELKKISKLSIRKKRLLAVLKHFGDNSNVKQSRSLDFYSPFSSQDDSLKTAIKSIVSFMKNHQEDEILPSLIIKDLGKSINQDNIYYAIKWLKLNQFLSQEDMGYVKKITRGPKWDEVNSLDA